MKNILIDFDGVIFKNEAIMKHIKDRSAEYVYSKGHSRTMDDAVRLNRKAYSVLGHTSLLYDKDIKEYNRFVFDIPKHYFRGLVTNEDFDHVNRIYKHKMEGDLNLLLFSNSPIRYCVDVFEAMDIHIDNIVDTSMMFTSDTGLLKPESMAYENVARNVKDSTLTFLDDNILNIAAVVDDPQWNPRWVTSDEDIYRELTR